MVDVVERISKDLISRDLSLECDFRKYDPFPFKPNAEAQGCILLVAGSAGSFKCWTTAHWIELYQRLRSRNLRAAVVGQPQKSPEVQELLAAGLPWISTPFFSDAVNVVSSADAMISVDTGLMHLSVQQGKPTVAIFLERSIFVRPERNCIPILAPDCVKECLGWITAPPNPEVNFQHYNEQEFVPCSAAPGKRCLEQISVDQVLDGLETAI